MRRTHDENYQFDVGGWIHVPSVLTPQELAACAASLAEGDGDPRQMDFFAGETVVDGYDGRWAAPWARLLGHPRLGGYLRELCGEGHRLDVAPALLPEVTGGGAAVELVGGGGGDIAARRVAYYHSNGIRIAQGVRVVWALADAPAGAGGLTLLPCTHRSVMPTPPAVAAGTDPATNALLRQPAMRAGDLLLIAATTLRGLRPWTGPAGGQHLFSYEVTSSSVFPSAGYITRPRLEPAESEAWAAQVTAAGRAEVGLRTVGLGGTALPTEGGGSRLLPEEEAAELERQREAAVEAMLRSSGCNPAELWFWTTFGFLVTPGIMDADWLRRCNAAVDALRESELDVSESHDLVHRRAGDKWPEGTSTKLRGGGEADGIRRVMTGMYGWPEPHGAAFRECVAHPEVVTRLNWMM